MSGTRFSFPACVIAGKGQIDSHDLMLLRRYAYADGVVTYEDALQLLALNDICPVHCREWPTYFVEQMTAFVLDRAAPAGRIDDLKAAWLVRVLGHDGVIDNALQLELLLHVMDAAGNYPHMLAVVALEQLRQALSDGPSGCYRIARNDAGAVDKAGIADLDVAYLWRVLRPASKDGQLDLSRMEASVLHAIDDLVAGRENHHGWEDIMESVDDAARGRGNLRSRPWFVGMDFGDDDDAADEALAPRVKHPPPQHHAMSVT